jgi:hypothetical protein
MGYIHVVKYYAGFRKEGNPVTCNKDESWEHYAKQNKVIH